LDDDLLSNKGSLGCLCEGNFFADNQGDGGWGANNLCEGLKKKRILLLPPPILPPRVVIIPRPVLVFESVFVGAYFLEIVGREKKKKSN